MRRLLALSIVLASVVVPYAAHADVQACLGASEKGQRARAAGKLRDARDQFLVCGGEGCPAMVRRDCAQWQGEVISMLPTVVFGAKDKAGRDLFDVTVSMDGETVARKLDGKSLAIDPGPHTFKFELAGALPVVERALIKEGEKTRVIAVTFAGGNGDVAAAPLAGSVTSPAADGDRPSSAPGSGHTVYPWIVVGVGAAAVITGVVVLLTAPEIPTGCDATTRMCAKITGETPSDFTKRQETAGRSEAQLTEGLIIGGIGVGVIAAGLLWHFLEPSRERTTATHISPWAAPGSTGLTLHASF